MIQIKCPFCLNEETRVLDSRLTPSSDSIRRRRECEDCSKRFTTYERIELSGLSVIKKDSRIEPFSREKLLKGIIRACEKRPVKREKIDEIVDKIESSLLRLEQSEIKSKFIGEIVMRFLKEIDEVAYIRFASVYRRFKDISQFTAEIKSLQQPKKVVSSKWPIVSRDLQKTTDHQLLTTN